MGKYRVTTESGVYEITTDEASGIGGVANPTDFGRYGGIAARGILEGTGSLGGTLADAAEVALVPNAYRTYQMARGQQDPVTALNQTERYFGQAKGLADSMGLPEPDNENFTERLTYNAGTFAPDVATGGKRVGGSLLSALMGSLGLTAAEEVTDNPYVRTAAAMTGAASPEVLQGVGKAGASVVRRGAPTAEQLDRSVGELIVDTGVTERNLDQAIAKKTEMEASGDPYAAFKSTGELTRNPSMAALEVNARAMAPAEYAEQQIARDRTRSAQLERTMPGKPRSGEEFGEGLRGTTEQAFFNVKDRLDNVYKSIDPEGKTAIPATPVRSKIRAKLRERGAVGSKLPLTREARSLVEEILTQGTDLQYRDKNLTLGQMIDYRSNVYEAADDLLAKGKKQQSGTMTQIGKILDEAIEGAAESAEGVTKEQAKAWRAANKQYKQFINTYDKGMIKSVVRGDRVEADRIADRLMNASPATVRKLKKAISEGTPEADQMLNEYRRQVLLRLSETARDATGDITLGGMKRALRMQSRKGMLKELFDRSHIRRLERLQNDLLSQERITKMGRKASQGQSYTTQGVLTAESIASKVLDGSLDRIPVVGKYVRLLRGNIDEATLRTDIGKRLIAAAMNPESAKLLVQSAQKPLPPGALEKILNEAFGAYAVTSGEIAAPNELP